MRTITQDSHPRNVVPFEAANPLDALRQASHALRADFIQAALWLNPSTPTVTVYEDYSYTTRHGLLDLASVEGGLCHAIASEHSPLPESLGLESYFDEMTVECRTRRYNMIEPHYDTYIEFSSNEPLCKNKIFDGRDVRVLTNLSDYTTLVFESHDHEGLSNPWYVPINSSLIFPQGTNWAPEKHLLHSEPNYDQEIDSAPAHILVANCLGPRI